VSDRTPHPLRATALLATLLAALSLTPHPVLAQHHITTPREEFGFDIGADYHLANYTQLVAYWQKLAHESDRMRLVRIGTTAEGRPMMMTILSAPENLAHLEQYRSIMERLTRARGLTDSTAHALAHEGKAIVWIDGGLHATEVLGAQQLIETVYRLVSATDPETERILHDDIILGVPANPDGMELVSNWYNRQADTLKRSTSDIPRLYEKYAGHDNNRDFFMANLPETQAMVHVMFRDWYPVIVYNHHQTGPAGTVMFSPPFRDPFNYVFDPLIPVELDLVAAAMHTRFEAEGLPGVTWRSGSNYSTWWNGGLRTVGYFHNNIGLLTETVGNPTPISIPLVPSKQYPHQDLPDPITPQPVWHFAQSLEYELTANWAVLDVASRYRETLLYNTYVMGRNAIGRGSRDFWTETHADADAMTAAAERAGVLPPAHGNVTPATRPIPDRFFAEMRDTTRRDPRGYVLSAAQPDLPRAVKFVNILIKGGVDVKRATAPFDVQGHRYPAGSFVVMTAQAYRPHVLDMFEPQRHPNDFAYPGGPPIPPYDITGWTPAMQMGVVVDRFRDPFTGPFALLTDTVVPPAGRITGPARGAGYLLRHDVVSGVIAVNRLLAAHAPVYWLQHTLQADGASFPAGTVYVPRTAASEPIVRRAAAQLGISFTGVATAPGGTRLQLQRPRIALWDRYGGSIPSGWTRWLLEQYEFPYTVVYPSTLDSGSLARRFDVIIFPNGAVPSAADTGRPIPSYERQPLAADIPARYRPELGAVTLTQTVPQLRRFLVAGGTVLAVGTSTNLAADLALPIRNALTDSATGQPLTRQQFYVPGSLLEVRVNPDAPLAYGMPDSVAMFYDQAPAFRLESGATLDRVAWFDSPAPLRSGWAWGQQHLYGATAVASARVGAGRLVLYGPEITFRGQPDASFPLLFNGIYYGAAMRARGPTGRAP